MPHIKTTGLLFLPLLFSTYLAAQVTDTTRFRTLAANPSLINKSAAYQKKWGKNRRVEWSTSVTVPVLWLDTAYGGLKPYEVGGGNETRSIRLTNQAGKEYSLRSINKSREDVVPVFAKGTFVEAIIKDQISSSYPYGAFAVAKMQEAAGIPHALPVLVYLPQQAALGQYNDKYGNDLYLLEQRPDGDWSDAANFQNMKDFSSTENVIKKLQENNKNIADQRVFIRSRLFDMLISDWDRHEDNFRWGKREEKGHNIYIPVPRDRDQAFYTHNGTLIDKLLPLAGLSFMHNFDSVPGSMKSFNSEEKDFDRFFTNAMTEEDWISEAKHLQSTLTDEVIASSVRDLPPEIYPISGEELTRKLIARRAHLQEKAKEYYLLMAGDVQVVGSSKREYFVAEGSNMLNISIYRIDKNGVKESEPYYKRSFKPGETREVRIFGINGEDVYTINNQTSIFLRVVAGPEKDSIVHQGSRIRIYDKQSDTIHIFKYEGFHYNTKGIKPIINYNDEDRLHVGLAYGFKKYKWAKYPYATEQSVGVKYSISQRAASAFYNAVWPHVIGRWDVLLNANFDAARWTNFYGLGNNSVAATDKIDYYRMISAEWVANLGIKRQFNNGDLEFTGFYRQVDLKTDTTRYATQVFLTPKPEVFDGNHYAGLHIQFTNAHVNDKIVPTRGFTMLLSAMLANNFTIHDFFQHYSARLQGFIPLGNKFSIALRAGGSTVVTDDDALLNAQPLMHAIIGGPASIRGFRKERFWGKSAFYNDNELRFITNIRSHLMTAKFGLLGFFDDGRVWMPGETSDKWHTGYGGGILLAPFSQLCLIVTYGISDEMKLLQIRMNKLF